MDNHSQPADELHKMRANRRVLETTCPICKSGFQMAEEVYKCPSCLGYHHSDCWDAMGQCPQSSVAFVSSAAAVDQAESVQGPVEGQAAPTTPLAPGPIQPKRKPISLAPSLAPDERRCPVCKEVIKQQALKCRFCGHALHSDLIGHPVPREIAQEIDKKANGALTCGIIGLFICAPVLGPMAISRGSDALKLLEEYPSYASESSARGKAKAGVTMGWIDLGLFVLFFIAKIGSI